MRSTHKVFLFLLVLAGFESFAYVNPLTRSYTVTHLDVQTSDSRLSLRRNYHSSRTSKGWFGLGMCTAFEAKIRRIKGREYFQYCGAGAIIPLDGSFGLSLKRRGNTFVVRSSKYNYVLDRNNQLLEIRDGNELAYKISHFDGQKRIQGKGMDLKLKFNNFLVVSAESKNRKLKYKYDSSGRLLAVKKDGKALYSYLWEGDLLAQYTGRDGLDKKYSFNKFGQVTKITERDCIESLSEKSFRKKTKLTVVRKCKSGDSSKSEYVISGEDKHFNYQIEELTPTRSRKLVMRGGFLASKQTRTTDYSYDYDSKGRIKRVKINDLLFTVTKRDRFHVKELSVGTQNTKLDKLAKIKLNWVEGRLVSYNLAGREWQFQDTKVGFKLKSPQYRLSAIRRGEKILLGGIWRGERVKPFRVDRGPASMSYHQQQILEEVAKQRNLKEALEAL